MLRLQRLTIVPPVIALAGAAFFLARGQEQAQVAAAKSNHAWSLAAAMSSPRSGACSVQLNDGRVLVAGGADESGPVSTVDIFNTDLTFSSASPMSQLRQNASCSLLADGEVLVAGGQGASGITNSAEIYNPDKDAWKPAGAMMAARAGATATTLKDQRVLLAGGATNSGPADSLEIYDPTTGAFTMVSAPMSSPRASHAAALLRDGEVLIGGGSDGSHALKTVDIFDPADGSVRPGVPMSTPRTGLSASALLDGTVLFAGGNNGAQDLATAEVFDPKSAKFGSPIAMSIPRSGQSATVLPQNNTVLITGGTSGGEAVSTTEIYVPWQNKFAPFGQLNQSRTDAVVSPYGNPGQLMIAGGQLARRPVGSSETTSFATIKSNQSNYLPGQTIVLTGAGWQPGETVQITIHVDPTTHPDVVLKAQADKLGKFTDSQYVDQQSDWGVTFYVTSLGLSSGRTAGLLTFTDGGGADTLGLNSTSPSTPPPGASSTYTFTATNTSGGGQTMGCVTLYMPSSAFTGAPSGTIVSASGLSWTVVGGTAPSGTNPGYVTFEANSSGNTIGNTPGSNTFVFAVTTTNPSAGGAQTWNPSGSFTMVVETNTGVNSSNVCKSNDFGFGGSVTTYVGATATTVTASPSGSSVYGQPVTFTAHVSNGGTAVTPTGSVTFYKQASGATCAALGASTSLGTGTLSGSGGNATATYSPSSPLSPATYSVLACYAGDTDDLASSNTTAGSTSTASSYTVNKANTTTTISSYTPTSSTYGTSVTFNVGVAAASPGAGTPTGTVNLVYNGTTICTATLSSGAGSCSTTVTSTSPLPAGSDSITAQYLGDTNFNTSASSATTETVSPKAITVGGITVNSKTYDGTTAATLNTSSATLSGVLSGDAGNVSLNTTGYTATFNSVNQGTGKGVAVSGLSLSGSAAGNYTLTQPTGLTGAINPATVTISGITVNSKTYDGTTSATLNVANATLSGVVSTDQSTVTLNSSGYTATFNSATQGTGKTVAVSGLSLNNNASGNYTLTQPTGLTGTVNVATVTVSGITVNSKTYDGTTTATLSFASATLSGVVAADQSTVTLNTSGYTAAFNSANQGSGKGVTVSGLSLSGSAAGNYTLTQPTGLTGTVNAVTVTVSGITVTSKTYNGTTSATLSFTSAALSGVLAADQSNVTLNTSGYTATFNNANQGTGKAVTVSGLSLSGSAAGNYTLTQPTSLTGTINAASVTVSGITVSTKAYDGTTTATLSFTSAALSGVLPADQSNVTLNTSGYTATFNNANQGTGKAVTVSGLSLSGSAAGNYTLTQPTGLTGTVNAVTVTVSGITVSSKTYNGTTSATLSFTSAALSGVLPADQSNVTLNTSGYTATFNNANQGTGKAVTVSGLSLSGSAAGNYTLTQPTSLTGTINAAGVTVSGITVSTKAYDGTTTATLSFTSAALSGVLPADQSNVTLNTSGYTATFNNANQGTGKAVTVSGLSLSGSAAGNYTLTQPTGLTGTVNAVTVTVSGITVSSKAYDSTTSATLSFTSAALSGVLQADQSNVTLNTSGYTATFNNVNQGTGKAVAVSGLSLSGSAAGNYTLTQPSGLTGAVTALTVTVSGITVISKPYDSTTTAMLNLTNAALSGVLSADQSTVTLNTTGYTAAFNSANQGTGKVVTVSGLSLNGNSNGNYTLTQPAGLTGTVTAVNVTVSGLTVYSKPYDSTTTATLNFTSAALSGVLPADQSSVMLNTSGYAAAFNNANQGSGKPVTVSALSLNSNTAGNYTLTQPTGLTGTITAVTVTVSGITVYSKPYDSTTTATLNFTSAALSGVLPADQSSVMLNTSGYAAAFNNANQGTGKVVTLSGLSLNGNTAGNYTLTQPAGLTGTINAASVTVSGITVISKAYDSTTTATLNFTSASLSGVLSADQNSVTLNTGGYSAAFNNANQGTGKAVTVSSLSLNNNTNGNYTLTQPTGLTGTITAVNVTVSGIAVNNKPYDGTTTATLNFASAALSGVLPADQSSVTLSASGYTALFSDANQGSGKPVTASALSLNSNSAGNYTLTQPTGLTGTITPATVTVSGASVNTKTYDGTVNATLNFTGASLSGVVPADQSSVTLNTGGYTASFNNANQGSGKAVTVGGLSLNNNGAGNYSFSQPAGLTGTINPAAVTVTGIAVNSKSYDGATNATLNFTGAALSGVLPADQSTVTLNTSGYSATFASANPGTGIGVTVAGLSLNGSGSGNYTVTQPMGLTGTITSASATTTITSALPSSPTYGQSVTFSGTVTGSGATPTGTVSVYYGSTLLCQATLASGAWSCSSSALPGGTDSVTATYGGNSSYNGNTSSPVTVTVGQASQSITFTSTPPTSVYATSPNYIVSATGGASGNPVTFSTSGSCAASGNSVSWTGAGVCTVKADQAGNGNYSAAPEVTQTFLVNSPLKAIGSINQVALTWLPYPGNTGYTIYRQTGCTGSWTQIATAATTAITYVDLTAAAASPGPLYCYYVAAGGFSPVVAQTPVADVDSITSAGFKGKTTTTVSTSNTNFTTAYATVNSTIATGSVVFTASQTSGGTGAAVCTGTLSAGVAHCLWDTPLTTGTWTIAASYEGNTTFAASTGSASITF